MSVTITHECDLCGKEHEKIGSPTEVKIGSLKPDGWPTGSRKADPRTGEKGGTLHFCSSEHKDAYNAAWQIAFDAAESKAMALFQSEFAVGLKHAKLKSRNAVDALAGLAPDA
jgi:hypothetical protein